MNSIFYILDYLVHAFRTTFSFPEPETLENEISFDSLDLLSRDELLYIAKNIYYIECKKNLSKKQIIELIQTHE